MNTCCENCSTLSVLGSDVAVVCTETATASIAGGISLNMTILVGSVVLTSLLIFSWKVIKSSATAVGTSSIKVDS
ncbi:MAG TPA: hypothetical protein DHW71_12565 [Gammaproteobacteria bacterium]|nr:hypothetical protein [Gammaproteobacteria bacterium]|tara:strand:+ start:126 stop:350 length:225 start_codon:yes stop_codon:yes gene_type:complete